MNIIEGVSERRLGKSWYVNVPTSVPSIHGTSVDPSINPLFGITFHVLLICISLIQEHKHASNGFLVLAVLVTVVIFNFRHLQIDVGLASFRPAQYQEVLATIADAHAKQLH
jgi:hypothetical protein